MSRKARPAFPGSKEKADIDAMIRVDHAGEYGAVRIYEGQLAVFGATNSAAVDAIRHMAEQEKRHLTSFDTLINKRRVRPTALEPVWRVAGFALGAATALLGERAAMACTIAVEEVIDEHYAKQVAALGDRMEEDEQKVLGKEGFERSVDKVATIETQLGINDLKQFTPHA